jgi:SAM-dependent methyltransferase
MNSTATMLRNLLAQPQAYLLFERSVGSRRCQRLYAERHIRPRNGDRILDIGCGPAEILEVLPPVDYHGFDQSPEYIASARRRFGARGHFHVEAVGRQLAHKYLDFDLVLAIGVLHHLTDSEAIELFQLARAALKPGGRLVTLDGCFVENQSPIARWLLKHDRGAYVRQADAYIGLACQVFHDVQPCLNTDLLRIPYTHMALQCRR